MPLNEFSLIDRFFKRPATSNVILGVGDDAAIVALKANEQLYVTTDCLVENIHFTSRWQASDVAYKALVVNLSDLSSMGARPKWFTLSLCLPAIDEAWLQEFSDELFACAKTFGVELIGGNTSAGALTISITMIGVSDHSPRLLRSNAKVGDAIYVTGQLGAAALGVLVHQQQLSIDANAQHESLSALFHPQPQLQAGYFLRDVANAAIDISDGFIADLQHICDASDVGANVQADAIPIATCVKNSVDAATALSLALTKGEDYQLIFTCDESQCVAIENHFAAQQWPLTRVGVVDAQHGVRIRSLEGAEISFKTAGYCHY